MLLGQYEKETEIIAIKVNNNMTFQEAKKEYEWTRGNSSYAVVSLDQNRLKEVKQREINMPCHQLEKMKGLQQAEMRRWIAGL